jgi:hypothetical protein
MALDILCINCPNCRERHWRLKFWRRLTHCWVCHGEREFPEFELNSRTTDPFNHWRAECPIYTPRALIN